MLCIAEAILEIETSASKTPNFNFAVQNIYRPSHFYYSRGCIIIDNWVSLTACENSGIRAWQVETF